MGTTGPCPFNSDLDALQNTRARKCGVVLLWADMESESRVQLHLENNCVTVVSVKMLKNEKDTKR